MMLSVFKQFIAHDASGFNLMKCLIILKKLYKQKMLTIGI